MTIPPEKDVHAFYMFSVQAWLGFVWWIASMFIYIRNFQQMKGQAGLDTIPLFWFFEYLTDPNYGWTAGSLLTNFVSGAIVALVEVVGFFFYLYGRPDLLVYWTTTVGFWFSTGFMILPWLFSIFQLSFDGEHGGLSGDTSVEYGFYTMFLLCGNLFAWLNSSMVHVFLSDRLRCHVEATAPARNRVIYKKCPLKRTFGQNNEEY